MRQLHVEVHPDQARPVARIAAQCGAATVTILPARDLAGRDWAVVLVTIPNDRVGRLAHAIEAEAGEAHLILLPRGVLPIETPLGHIQQGIREVSHRSALELVFDANQSIGSWTSMLLYAAFSGLIAAYAAIYGIVYLLVAAMLIAPMGGPVLVSVIGAALGDVRMFGRGLLRFVVSIAVLIAVAVVFGYAAGVSASTPLMDGIASIPPWVALLAAAGGAAGAQAQIRSERDSLVTTTATGFLIAVSLAPAAAVLGLSLLLGNWTDAGTTAFVLLLNYAGILVGGSLLLAAHGVGPDKPTASHGTSAGRRVLVAGMLAATLGLVAWQAGRHPELHRRDLARQAIEITRAAGPDLDGARLLHVSARFVKAEGISGHALLVNVTAERTDDTRATGAVAEAIREAVAQRVRVRMHDVVPYVDVSVLP